MKKNKIDIWMAQAAALIRALCFSTLEPETQKSLKREMFFFNNSRIVAVAAVIFILETANIVNVLCFSKSGLTTPNNRLYFVMYLIMLVSALICLVILHVMHRKPELLMGCYVGFTLFWVLWHAVLSAIDLRHNPNIVVFMTGILALSLLMRFKPIQMLSIIVSGLIVLLCGGGKNLSNGIVINAVIVSIITILIVCSRYFSTLEELGYRQKMILQENHRRTEKQRLSFLTQQQEALLHHSKELLFLWDKELNTLVLAGGRSLCEADREAILTCEYLIACTEQLDCDNEIIGAAGVITPKA